MHALLEAQAYRLSYWRVAGDEINYRRFFDINDLTARRVNEPAVFDATHALILSLQQRCGSDLRRKPLYVVMEKILAPHERLPDPCWFTADAGEGGTIGE